MTDKAGALRKERADRRRDLIQKIRDRRRFTDGPAASGIPKVVVDRTVKGTVFPHTLMSVENRGAETILKDGAMNSKIGGDVMVGRLKGAKIYTLALEERATCPATCRLWTICYGNSLNRTRRWRHGPKLEKALDAEVRALCAKGGEVLVRLHVVGDFYNWDYLRLWVKLLDDLPNLSAFGFTAHPENSRMGKAIARVRDALGLRFAVRTSDKTGDWGSFTIDFPTEKARLGDATVCPEQRALAGDAPPGTHCGNCGACWQSARPIVFTLH